MLKMFVIVCFCVIFVTHNKTKIVKMKTITIEYNQTTNFSEVMVNGFCVATLNHNKDEFEDYEEMTEAQKDEYYGMMIENREDIISDDYDVCAEQGLYTYGY